MSLRLSESDLHGSNRALWAAVVLQVKNDIESEALDSLDYAQAVAFVTGSGSWIESRLAIADMLELHPDDIVRMGRDWIAARRLKEGLPEDSESTAQTVDSTQAHYAVSTNHASVAPLPVTRPARVPATAPKRVRAWRMKSEINPFNPFRHQVAARSA
jgi:hypothetical protein